MDVKVVRKIGRKVEQVTHIDTKDFSLSLDELQALFSFFYEKTQAPLYIDILRENIAQSLFDELQNQVNHYREQGGSVAFTNRVYKYRTVISTLTRKTDLQDQLIVLMAQFENLYTQNMPRTMS
jgi:hypothetical protein